MKKAALFSALLILGLLSSHWLPLLDQPTRLYHTGIFC
jgi:hypothetical protein